MSRFAHMINTAIIIPIYVCMYVCMLFLCVYISTTYNVLSSCKGFVSLSFGL